MPGTVMEKFLIQFLCRGVQGSFSVLLSTSEPSDVENSIPGDDGDGSKIGTEVFKALQFWRHLPCGGPW